MKQASKSDRLGIVAVFHFPLARKEACMWYVGLDVHAKQSTYCVLDANGKKVRTHTVHGPWDKVLLDLAFIKEPWVVGFEASCGYGVLKERLAKVAQRVVVAHPGHLRLIFRSKQKNDRVDAEKLALLL